MGRLVQAKPDRNIFLAQIDLKRKESSIYFAIEFDNRRKNLRLAWSHMILHTLHRFLVTRNLIGIKFMLKHVPFRNNSLLGILCIHFNENKMLQTFYFMSIIRKQ